MASQAMEKKAVQSQIVFEDLKHKLNIQTTIPTTFIVDESRHGELMKACHSNNPFGLLFGFVIVKLRKKGVNKLFEDEKVLQTPAVAAVLATCSSVATSIGALRGDAFERTPETFCDVAFAGMQAFRLFMSDSKDPAFKKVRVASAVRVNNAWNGSSYKYQAGDERHVSFHVYYQSQQKKLVDAFNLNKPSEKYTMLSTRFDMKKLRQLFRKYTSDQLEELAFDCDACGCKIRSRDEWESTEVGKAVCEMPLVRFEEKGRDTTTVWGKPNSRGPLSGIKILDLTHIIAGPACSRVLAEYGADLLMVRRGKFIEQEQAMLELDGWAGKNSIQLDLNESAALERIKQLIREADVITYSYQSGALDKFGLSQEEIYKLNPNIIYSNLMCFSDSVWRNRPGWAPLAEDITGLSVRNGSLENPINLNGVPLDYIPGMILALGTLLAIERKLKDGTTCTVTTSLTRGAQWLHECTDICEKEHVGEFSSRIAAKAPTAQWDKVLQFVDGNSIGKVGFPTPATYNTVYPDLTQNMKFNDGCKGWQQ